MRYKREDYEKKDENLIYCGTMTLNRLFSHGERPPTILEILRLKIFSRALC